MMRPNLPRAVTPTRHPGSSLVVNIGFAAFSTSGICLDGSTLATNGLFDSFSLCLNVTRRGRRRIASALPIDVLKSKQNVKRCVRKSREASIYQTSSSVKVRICRVVIGSDGRQHVPSCTSTRGLQYALNSIYNRDNVTLKL